MRHSHAEDHGDQFGAPRQRLSPNDAAFIFRSEQN
jgi:hypothetical protein